MGKILLNIITVLFWAIFIFVIFQVPYPESLTQANTTQLISFFIPLYLSLIFTLNIFLKNISISASLSLGLIFLLILKALDSLNLVTGLLILVSVYLLVSYFKKGGSSGLTLNSKIPKLHSLRRKRQ